MKLSVAMCTFHGARFLPEQLASISAQDLPVDELVVCDDGSEDGTWDLLQEYANTTGIHVRLTRNEYRLGSSRNFEQALALTTGDVIFLADQDDVWYPSKTRTAVEALASCASALLAFSNADIVGDSGTQLGYRAWDSVRLTDAELLSLRSNQALDVLLDRPVVTGATITFRRQLLESALPFPAFVREGRDPRVIHDGWLALAAAARGPIAAIEQPLMAYRQHDGQQIGLALTRNVTSDGWRRGGSFALQADASHVRRQINVVEILAQHNPGLFPRLRNLVERQDHYAARTHLATLPRLFRLPRLGLEVFSGRYRRHSNGLMSAGKDLVAPSVCPPA